MADPKIRYDIQATAAGGADVNALAASLEKLDAAVDPAVAARAAAVAEELRKLGSQQAAIDRFRDLKTSTGEAAAALEVAQAKAQELGKQISFVGVPTKAQVGLFERLKQSVKDTREEFDAQQRALERAREGLTAVGLSTTGLATSQAQVRTALQGAQQEAAQLATRYSQLATAQQQSAAEGAAAMAALEAAAQREEAAFQALAVSLRSTEQAAQSFAAATQQSTTGLLSESAATAQRVRAAEQLLATDAQLTAEQRALAQARDAGRASLVAEAQQLTIAARAAEESRAATARLVAEARSAGQVLDQAFAQTGVRSLNAIEGEIAQTEAAVSTLQRRFEAGAISAQDLARGVAGAQAKLATLRTEAATLPSVPGAIESISNRIGELTSRFGAISAAAATIGLAVRPAIEAAVALEQMRRTLTTVTGSAETAERQLAALRITAQQSGQDFTTVGQSYAKFATAALQSGLNLQQVDAVFKSVSLAAGNLGLSTEESGRALTALSQIASKGVVQMEELRGQLGEALPGVLPLLAKELGLTQAELNKVVESGNLLATEAVPAIGRALQSLGPQSGQVDGIAASWARFKNIVSEAGAAIVDGPLGKGVGAVLGLLADGVGRLAFVAVSASNGIEVLGKAVGTTAAFLAGGAKDVDAYTAALSGFATDAAKRIENFRQVALGAEQGTAGLSAATEKASESFAKLGLRQAESVKAAEQRAAISEVLAQAVEKEAEAVAQVTALVGDEREAAERYAASTATVAAARVRAADAAAAEATTLRASRDAAIEKARADGKGEEAIKALTDKLRDKIKTADAEAEKSQAQADKANAVAASAALAALKIGDQSSKLGDLRTALDAAQRAYDAVVRSYENGKATTEDVRKADDALVKAKNLLRDAVDDLDKALKRNIDTLKADLDIKRAGLQLDLEQAKNAQRLAQERGNETAARQAGIRILEIEQALSRSAIAGKLQEAEATLRYVAQKEAELRALNQLTPERQQELDLLRKSAIATTLQEAATREANKAKDEQIERTRGLRPALDASTEATTRSTTATGANTGAVEGNSAALAGNANQLDKVSSARQRYNNLLAQTRALGGADGNAGTLGDGSDTAARNATVRSGAAPGSFGELFANTPSGGTTRTVSTGQAANKPAGNWTYVLTGFMIPGVDAAGNRIPGGWREVESPQLLTGGTASPRAASPAPAPVVSTPAAPSAAKPQQIYVTNVDLGSRSFQIKTTDRDSQQSLLDLLEAQRRAAGE